MIVYVCMGGSPDGNSVLGVVDDFDKAKAFLTVEALEGHYYGVIIKWDAASNKRLECFTCDVLRDDCQLCGFPGYIDWDKFDESNWPKHTHKLTEWRSEP